MKRLIYILFALLGFGFTSCEEIGKAEYGVPHVSFKLKARVVDEAGKPIQGIEVRTEDDEPFEYNTGISDYKGNIDAYGGFWPGAERGQVQFIDIDGEANGGEYETQLVKLTNVEQIGAGDGNWHEGSYRVDVGTVVMKLKEVTDEENTESEENSEE
ncbi:MAG: radical SAM-associated putative lipoprotein [Alistipes sp.]|nr:radical SAM-associated putative lipoprotein [Alistipes sp.]